MRYSLISRDWIADCVEIMHEAYAAVSTIIISFTVAMVSSTMSFDDINISCMSTLQITFPSYLQWICNV